MPCSYPERDKLINFVIEQIHYLSQRFAVHLMQVQSDVGGRGKAGVFTCRMDRDMRVSVPFGLSYRQSFGQRFALHPEVAIPLCTCFPVVVILVSRHSDIEPHMALVFKYETALDSTRRKFFWDGTRTLFSVTPAGSIAIPTARRNKSHAENDRLQNIHSDRYREEIPKTENSVEHRSDK